MSTAISQPLPFSSPAVFDWPDTQTVSVIIPCYNEEKFIGKALANLVGQHPANNFEVVVVDGLSTDLTRKVVNDFRVAQPNISIILIDNPARTIPHALNLGIAAARGEIIARIDAHAAPSTGYIRRCVEVLSQPDTAVVGMPCRIKASANTPIARAISIAVSNPFGIGDAKYRLDAGSNCSAQEEVDTVAFACFRKSLWTALSGFNEKLLTNEDYDFNYRVRERGFKVVLDRAEHCDYFARPDLKSLAQQYLRYGFWKARMIKQQPRSLKLRHLAAPTFVAAIAFLALLGFATNVAWFALASLLFVYLVTALTFSFQAPWQHEEWLQMALRLPLVFATIHLCWGTSFWFGLLKSPRGLARL